MNAKPCLKRKMVDELPAVAPALKSLRREPEPFVSLYFFYIFSDIFFTPLSNTAASSQPPDGP